MLNPLLILAMQMAIALMLDRLLGELTRYHPLVGFGHLTNFLEAKYNTQGPSLRNKLAGALCLLLLTIPLPAVLFVIGHDSIGFWLIETLFLYLAIGQRSLKEHGMQVYRPLAEHNIQQARHYTGYLVSRDTADLTPRQMQRAVTESMLENGHDGSIASLFYFALGGAPLAVLHRLVNTLDAMWGYKSSRFIAFGWAAAKLDDLLGYPSAICTSLLYLLVGSKRRKAALGLRLAFEQSARYKSKNGGLCMSAGAFSLGIRLGGKASYHGHASSLVRLGLGRHVQPEDIPASISLVITSSRLLVGMLLLAGLFWQFTLNESPL